MLKIRSATLNDAQLLYDWVNESKVRENAFMTGSISWDSHVQWLIESIQNPNCFIFIFSKGELPIGQVRFNYRDNCFLIDYSVDKIQRGRGYGCKIIVLAMNELKHMLKISKISIVAKVKAENTPSIRVFEKLSFIKDNIIENDKISYCQFSREF